MPTTTVECGLLAFSQDIPPIISTIFCYLACRVVLKINTLLKNYEAKPFRFPSRLLDRQFG
jgi:hypothetical protein